MWTEFSHANEPTTVSTRVVLCISKQLWFSVGTISHSNLQASNTNFLVSPPPSVNAGHLPPKNQMGANPNFSSQVQQQQNVASGSSQAPSSAKKKGIHYLNKNDPRFQIHVCDNLNSFKSCATSKFKVNY
jgi:hypothetical protein